MWQRESTGVVVTYAEICEELVKTLAGFQKNAWNRLVETPALMQRLDLVPEDESAPDEIKKARAQKGLLLLMKETLASDPKRNLDYPAKTEWKWLNQLLAATRLRELTDVKIVVKGRKGGAGYHIDELLACFYGKQIIASLKDKDGAPLIGKRRRVVDKSEFETIKKAFLKIKLRLPETIEPTKTELFFAAKSSETSDA